MVLIYVPISSTLSDIILGDILLSLNFHWAWHKAVQDSIKFDGNEIVTEKDLEGLFTLFPDFASWYKLNKGIPVKEEPKSEPDAKSDTQAVVDTDATESDTSPEWAPKVDPDATEPDSSLTWRF